ncbi:MAG TPA: prolyl oligopeptidase family serine peptidase [Steroidobacteraceae bacterium]|nr:prolyl oligopeptidase family serine peptidase [Steroidobacteraceae bacterium]
MDDLIRRAKIANAALSPNGRFAAYVVARADPMSDQYELTIRVVDTQGGSPPRTLRSYRLSPEETFNQLEWFQRGAGELRWLRDDLLLFTTRSGEKTLLCAWDARSSKASVILDGHDRIESEDRDGGQDPEWIATDFIPAPGDGAGIPRDTSWRIRDSYEFYGPLQNPKQGHYLRKQRWKVLSKDEPTASRDGGPWEQWGDVANEAPWQPPEVVRDQEVVTFDETTSRDGKWVAAVEVHANNLANPDATYNDFRIVVRGTEGTKVLVPATRPFVMGRTAILGWSGDSRSLYYIHVDARTTAVRKVGLDGNIQTIWRGAALLVKPLTGPRSHQLVSRDGRWALLIRSTNTTPDELVKLDLGTGEMTVLDSPNTVFLEANRPRVTFYDLEDVGAGDAWGRLYLPENFVKGTRYPLVITQYASSPGFAESVGDEIPIPLLLESGIAVFDMYSAGLVQSGVGGKYALVLSRDRRPLAGMKWIVQKLQKEGVVDPNRIGIAGLSYGAEIAMYAYWNWPALRAVSVATTTWDPHFDPYTGPNYQNSLNARGLPPEDEAGMRAWRELAAGLNASPSLPPLLVQSPDREEIFTIPTWSQLRHARASVEWYEYPDEGHVKAHPANKWWVYQRNLDWFRFWLKDEEDPNPDKQDQYARWREFRTAHSP